MTEPIFHSRTESAIENYLNRPTHGLIISGPEGSGKYFTAIWLANRLEASQLTVKALDSKNTIAIEQIRELYTQTRTGMKMTVIIKEADTMGIEAQNAFLKLLEEPPQNTYFILTVSSAEKLLPTIRSRAQKVTLHNPSQLQISEHMIKIIPGLDKSELDSLIQTNQGRVGSLSTLISSPEDLEIHKKTLAEAKNFYMGDKYSRHTACISHNFDREWLDTLLGILTIIIHALLKTSTENHAALKRLNKQAEVVEQTITNITKVPGNPKIHMARLIELL